MRPRTAAAATPRADAPPPRPRRPAVATPTGDRDADAAAELGIVRDLRRPISVRFNLGYVVDGTALTGKPNAERSAIAATSIRAGCARTRSARATSARAACSLPSLSTYFADAASRSRAARRVDADDPTERTPSASARRSRRGSIAAASSRARCGPRSKDFLPDRAARPAAPARRRALRLRAVDAAHVRRASRRGTASSLQRERLRAAAACPTTRSASFFDSKDRAGIAGASAARRPARAQDADPVRDRRRALAVHGARRRRRQASNHGDAPARLAPAQGRRADRPRPRARRRARERARAAAQPLQAGHEPRVRLHASPRRRLALGSVGHATRSARGASATSISARWCRR